MAPSSSLPTLPRRDYLMSGRPTSIPSFLRRLGYIVALTLGVSGTVALFWSTFLLPLLYSSFSARKAVTEQQLNQVQAFVRSITSLRKQKLYSAPFEASSSTEERPSHGQEVAIAQDKRSNLDDSLLIEDMDQEVSVASAPPAGPAQPKHPLSLISGLLDLPNNLGTLSAQMESTTTTRTSLISTVSSYTSWLHTQMFMMTRAGGNNSAYYGGVGLKTLGESLEKEGVKSEEKTAAVIGGKSPVWDELRKEIRAIKGMLLSRRNFSQR